MNATAYASNPATVGELTQAIAMFLKTPKWTAFTPRVKPAPITAPTTA